MEKLPKPSKPYSGVAASLAAALKISYDSVNEKKILFLTGRQSQHRIVVDTIKSLNERKDSDTSDIKLVDIIGREGMCKNIQPLTGECSCEVNIEEGSRKSRRIRLANRILESPMHVEEIIQLAEKVESCPWAAARFAAKGARVIVCDYNHVFIENVMELSLPAMGVELENTILIVDEAHNLPDRIRNPRKLQDILLLFYPNFLLCTPLYPCFSIQHFFCSNNLFSKMAHEGEVIWANALCIRVISCEK